MASGTDYLLDPEFLEEVVQGIVDEATERMTWLIEAMVAPDGRVWPQVRLPRAERVMSILDDGQRGVLDAMLDLGFERDVDERLRTLGRDTRALGVSGLTMPFLPPLRPLERRED